VAFREGRRLKLEARGALRTEIRSPGERTAAAPPRTVVARPALRQADGLAAVATIPHPSRAEARELHEQKVAS
jgi:hypothetical protein